MGIETTGRRSGTDSYSSSSSNILHMFNVAGHYWSHSGTHVMERR